MLCVDDYLLILWGLPVVLFFLQRQIVLGGRNRYLINGTSPVLLACERPTTHLHIRSISCCAGHNAQLSRVQNLFHSVQLNVNNPHFLIMQGRITEGEWVVENL